MKLVRFCMGLLLSTMLIISCSTNDDEAYEIGDVFDNTSSNIFYTDTLTVNAHTVLLDSFYTSGYNKVFVGSKEDDYLGKISATSYIPFGFSTVDPIIDADASFDSLVLVLTPNGEYLGDTSVYRSFAVHELLDTISPFDNGYFYNNTKFAYSTDPLKTKSFRPHPLAHKKIYVSFPELIGQAWMDSIIAGAEEFETSADFQEFFKGIAIVPNDDRDSWSTSFYGLTDDWASGDDATTSLELRLYYTNENADENTFYSFLPSNSAYIFSNFETDYTGTRLAAFNSENDQLSSAETDHLIYLQSGSGLAVKIDIPALDRINEISSNMSILDAELILKPRLNSFDNDNTLPTSFNAYWTDKKNRIGDLLYNVTGEYALTGTLHQDEEFKENTYYSIPILNYILVKASTDEFTDDDLMFIVSSETFSTSFKHMVLEDNAINGSSMQLKLYYVTY